MQFNSLEYACLLLFSMAFCWLLSNKGQWRIYALLLASYLFYASWNLKYLALIFLSSSMDYFLGSKLARESRSRYRKLLLGFSLVVNLGILCTFKYFNFFVAEITDFLVQVGIRVTRPELNVLLPVGISFYTFQTLSYTIDIYRKKLEPAKSYFNYLLFVSFFPQLVAGPIVRASVLLPQLARRPKLTVEQGSVALYRIGIGLVKKIAIADFLGAHLVDPVFSNPEMYSSIETLVAAYAYSFQIYADFSAYSDIAIGSAALLGVNIPENFNLPYRSTNLREFWQRWHISLSTWLRDYLYIPLGGSRGSRFRTYVNLMITMVLGGLWHGAATTFLAWGAIHGLCLVGTRIFQRARPRAERTTPLLKAIKVLLTFHLVTAAWVFFRSSSFESAFQLFSSIFVFDLGYVNLSLPVVIVLTVALLTHWFPKVWVERLRSLFVALPAPLQAATIVGAVLAVQQLAQTEVEPFIYFQF